VYCTHCGTERADGATICANCGQQVQVFALPERVPNYLWQSIVTTLCCCPPFGVVALLFAVQVSSKLAAGDEAGAQAASAKARKWSIVALVAGIVVGAVSAVLVALQ
jgi:hypothetical protein